MTYVMKFFLRLKKLFIKGKKYHFTVEGTEISTTFVPEFVAPLKKKIPRAR